MIRTSSGFIKPEPSTVFIPEIWKSRIGMATHEKIALKYPKLIFNYEGEILRQGDIVWFPNVPHYHGLIADKTLFMYFPIDNPIYLQSCSQSMKETIDHISEDVINNIERIPDGPALFASQVTEVEHLPSRISGNIRILFVYGYRSLNPIRMATEIITRCQRNGLSNNQTIRELERVF